MEPVTQDQIADVGLAIDTSWLLLAGALVFFMQAGFAMLEAGSVRTYGIVFILYKNIIDACISGVVFTLVGYGVAFGENSSFIGRTKYFGVGVTDDEYAFLFFQWAFSATAATIVSGAVAERVRFEAYIVVTTVLTAFIYPVVAHWVWSGDGWLAVGNELFGEGMIDFAGSGVVHLVGGLAGLVGAAVVGARTGRFVVNEATGRKEPADIAKTTVLHKAMTTLGTLILWFGWYGFNAGSTLGLTGGLHGVAAKAALNTTVAAASSTVTALVLSKALYKEYDLALTLNATLGGLVAITASCSVVDLGLAFVVGALAGPIYMLSSYAVLHWLKVDDPLDAFSVHGACGIWGVLTAGIFPTNLNKMSSYGAALVNRGNQFGAQVVGILAIIAWVGSLSLILFSLLAGVIPGLPNFLRHEYDADDKDFLILAERAMSKMSEMNGLSAENSGINHDKQEPAAAGTQMEVKEP